MPNLFVIVNIVAMGFGIHSRRGFDYLKSVRQGRYLSSFHFSETVEDSFVKCRLTIQVLLAITCFCSKSHGGPALVLEVTYAQTPPALDGVLADWTDVEWHIFAPDAPHCLNLMNDDGADEPGISKSSSDLSGSFAMQWDNDWIYLATRVSDNIHSVPDSTEGNWYLNDSISLFFDVPLDGDGPAYRLGDHSFSFVADPAYPHHGQWWRYGNRAGRRIEQSTAAGHAQVGRGTRLAVKSTDSGYELEAAIPLRVLLPDAETFAGLLARQTFGFMFLATDVDKDVRGDFDLQSQINFGGDDDDDSKWSRLYFAPPIEYTDNTIKLSGRVTYLGYGTPWIGRVRVQRDDQHLSVRTDNSGRYSVDLPAGAYTLNVGTETLPVELPQQGGVKNIDIEVPPTIARLHFSFLSNVEGGFEPWFADKIAPILTEHGLHPIDHSKWDRIDTVRSRLFAFSSPNQMLQKRIALETDPAWKAALADLYVHPQETASGTESRVEFLVFETPRQQELKVALGGGTTHEDAALVHTVNRQRSGDWFHLTNFAGSYSPSINKIVQDDHGFLWFGTNSALIRYDGARGKQYNEGNVLPGRTVISLEKDRQGNIWAGTSNSTRSGGAFGAGGLSRLHNETWTTFKTSDGLIQSMVLAISQDSRDRIWVGTSGGVSRLDDQQWTMITPANGLAHNVVHAIYEDHTGVIWFGTEQGVSRYDGYTWRTYTSADGLGSDNVYAITGDKAGDVWFGTANGASRFDGRNFVTFRQTIGDSVRAFLESSNGDMWCATHNGAKWYNGQKWFTFTTQDGLLSNNILSLFQDREGSLWFGTNKGASQYFGDQVTSFTDQAGLSSNVVLSVYEDSRQNIWFGTEHGLDVYDGHEITAVHDEIDNSFGAVASIASDRFDNLWISSSNYCVVGGRWRRNSGRTGVRRFDGETWSALPILGKTDNGQQLPSGIIEGPDGKMWFGDYDNLVRVEGASRQRMGYGIPKLADTRGHVWSGSWQGEAIRFDGENFFTATVGDTSGRFGSGLMDIFEDRHGTLWFANNDGLKRMDGTDDRVNPGDSLHVGFTRFSTDNGLAYHWATSLVEDDSGILWIGTYGGGISLFDGFVFQNISMQDGLPGNIVRDLSMSKDGDVLVATESGAAILKIDRTPPPVNINAVIADENYGPAPSVKIPSSQNIVIIDFQGTSFKSHGNRMLYKYRLTGFESEWRFGAESRVQYTNVPNGDYKFEVYAIDRNLNYSEVPATVDMVVHPPYFELGLQLGLGLSIVGLFVAMGMSLRHRARNEEVQQRLVSEQKKRLSEQSILMRKLEEANSAIQDANRQIENQNRELSNELTKAHEMQSQLMPVESPKTAVLDLYGFCRPASHVGGDFFQYFHHDQDSLVIAIADVTGHGMQAAIPAVLFGGILQNEMEELRASEEHMDRLNRSLHRTLGRHTFVCCCIVIVDLNRRRASVVNGGCPYPYFYSAQTGEIGEVSTGGLPLGAMPHSEYATTELELKKGDVMVFCSDGIVEANKGDEIYGFDRTTDCVQSASSANDNAEQIAKQIFAEVDSFVQNEDQNDDQTVVVLKVK